MLSKNQTADLFDFGDLVISTAGHDKEKYFIVISRIDELYVCIADGRVRKIDKPKKKKVKHIKLVRKADGSFVNISADGENGAINRRKLTNSALRKHISKILSGISGSAPSE